MVSPVSYAYSIHLLSLLLPHPFSTVLLFFFFNDTATTEIYTLSLHDALPISWWAQAPPDSPRRTASARADFGCCSPRDRKSTRLNSSHEWISYAVFCLKKKKKKKKEDRRIRYNMRKSSELKVSQRVNEMNA